MHRKLETPKNGLASVATEPAELLAFVGGDILSLVTSGMYTTPLSIYREYIQNAADSIVASNDPENGRVEVSLHLDSMSLSIRDNGPGLSRTQAIKELLPIAMSNKSRQTDRGFRGIGRLSGLAFGESVTFLTRHNETDPVTKVVWNGSNLRSAIDNGLSIEKTISDCVTVDTVEGNGYPAHFFEVQVGGISRYAAASILNRDLVREYIGEVCPVPFSKDFPYVAKVSSLFEEGQDPFALKVLIDGGDSPVTRLYGNSAHLSGDRLNSFTGFEKISIPALGGEGNAAIGWVAHSLYLGALPPSPSIRCVRARVGNIQVGDETVFDHMFSESRFNRWCVAEIHILDPRIVPNGRRDYFEPSPHLRNLENRISAVCRGLERKCRMSSGQRNEQKRFQSFVDSVNAAYDLATSRYLTPEASKELVAKKLSSIEDLRNKREASKGQSPQIEELNSLEKKLVSFKVSRGRMSFPGIPSSEVSTYRNIFQILAEVSPSPQATREIIDAILIRARKENYIKQ